MVCRRLLYILCILLLGQQVLASLGDRKDLFLIEEIRIEGVKKVEKEAVLEKIYSKKGMMLDNYLLKKDIERIYSMRYFDYVEAQQDGRVLLFKVKERPIVSKIVINGNNDVDFDDLTAQIKTKEFSILDVNTIKNDVTALQKFYEEKGYYLASIDFAVRPTSNETVEVVFSVREFDKVRVKNIIFLGNTAFVDREIKEIMETREESFFSFLSGSGNFKEFNFQRDIELIKYFYKTKGYLQVNVGTPDITISEDKKWVFITIKITEGPQFTVNDITFQGEVLFSDEELLQKISLKRDEIYSEEKYQRDVQLLTEMYQDKGYAFANVLRHLQPVPGENRVDVLFSFEKGKIAHFGNIVIKGNTKTRDKVIRRELLIKEGAKFSGSALRRSKENVNRLGFFEPDSIIFNTISPKGRDDVLDVEITVKETNTGQISLGAGYSTATGEFIQASIAQRNFQGRGQNLSFSFSHSKYSNSFSLGFTEPYLFDSKWTAGGDLYYTDNSYSTSFDYKRGGGDVRIGYPIMDYTRLYLSYKLENTKLSHVEDPTVDQNLENGWASIVSATVAYDKRDNRMQTTGGHYASLSYEYAGVGGSKKWTKGEFDGKYFYNVIGDLVLRSRLNVMKLDRVGGQAIPRTERFVLGGARDLRGYNYEDIGPKIMAYNSKGVLKPFNEGGLFATVAQLELEHPLAREAGLKWVIFMDAGNVYRKYFGANGDYNLYYDYGFGFRWFSPIGVLRFEFGYPLSKSVADTGMKFHFDIGPVF